MKEIELEDYDPKTDYSKRAFEFKNQSDWEWFDGATGKTYCVNARDIFYLTTKCEDGHHSALECKVICFRNGLPIYFAMDENGKVIVGVLNHAMIRSCAYKDRESAEKFARMYNRWDEMNAKIYQSETEAK